MAALYPPGSTFKPVVALAALESGAITPDTAITCPGYLELGDATFHCWQQGGHGTLRLHDAIKQSCDVFFYETARRTGIDRIAAMARRFGFGAPLGLDIPGERGGLIPTREWKLATTGVSLAAGRDADHRHRPGFGAGDAAAGGDDGGAAGHRPRGRAARRARATALMPPGGDRRPAELRAARHQPAQIWRWCSTA